MTSITGLYLGVALIGSLFLFEISTVSVSKAEHASLVKSEVGHYPPEFCRISNVVFVADKRKFFYESATNDLEDCKHVADIWPLENKEDLHLDYKCDETFDIGYAFTIYYWINNSNYYHLHKDTLIPLYGRIYHNRTASDFKGLKIAFMPTVETIRLKDMFWDTDAFKNENAFWYETLEAIAGNHTLLPLNETFLRRNKATCFKQIYFGSPSIDYYDKELMAGFINYMKAYHNIKEMKDEKHRVGLISRSNRRLIVNEDELIEKMEGKVDLIKFDGMSFKDQIQLMQKYQVLLGMNGAGLMNGIYLPRHAVVVQLVPYKAGLNYGWYGDLLHTRGPYLEWHNKHENNTRRMENDNYNNNPDTFIEPAEFNHTVLSALAYGKQQKLHFEKDEL